MERTYNFSAGPAILPTEVLELAQKEMLNYNNTGMSVMELSHRSKYFEEIIEAAEVNLRKLLDIPDNYKVLFLQGGASLIFSSLVMNLRQNGKLAYVDSGNFANKAIKAAQDLQIEYDITVDVVASSKADNYTSLPLLPKKLEEDYDYIHMCSNNTIEGTQMKTFKQYGDIPLVVDMSSDLLSRPLDISKFGMIYGGAQKNLGIAGLTIVIIREELIGLHQELPLMLNFKTFADANSLYNTPPTYAVYIHKLVTDWIIAQGGLEVMKQRNIDKAQLLYDYLDASKLFKGTAEKSARSVMNITFSTDSEELDKKFIELAEENNFKNIKGYRSLGGMRASIYNAFPKEGIEALVTLMKKFESENQ